MQLRCHPWQRTLFRAWLPQLFSQQERGRGTGRAITCRKRALLGLVGAHVLERLLAGTRLGCVPACSSHCQPEWWPPCLHPASRLRGSTWGEPGCIPKGAKPTHVDQQAPNLVAKWLKSVQSLLTGILVLRGNICMDALGYTGICPVTASGGEFAATS